MTTGEVQLLEMHKGKLEAWGWRWRFAGHDSILVVLTHFGCILNAAMNDLDLQASSRFMLQSLLGSFQSVGECLSSQPCIKRQTHVCLCFGSSGVGHVLRNSHMQTSTCHCWCFTLQVYLHQLAETNGSSSLPPAVTRILNAKACRSAIMFGDPLLPTECAQLIASLKMTQLCFSCAHGRPTLAPLVNLQALRNHISMHNSASLAAKPSLNDTAPLKQRLCNLLKHS